jgi:hypothetical protein
LSQSPPLRTADHCSVELRERTMQRIAEALNVAQSTITEDLRGLSTVDKPRRPKGGRPKPPKKFSRESQRRQATK